MGKMVFYPFLKPAGLLWKMKGEHNQRMASDSDVYKIIEGVSYSLHNSPNKELEDFTDNLITIKPDAFVQGFTASLEKL